MTMTSAETILNDVLITLNRSLLQYVREAWPWTDSHTETVREAVMQSSSDQAETVDRLTELLRDRGYPVSVGNFPDFSMLNYVGMDFLLKRLVQNQKQVVAACDAAARNLASDPEDGLIVEKIAVAEGERLKQLDSLATKNAL